MNRRFLYIINPISGTRSKETLQELIEKKTGEAGFEYSIHPSVADGNYAHLHRIIKKQGVTDVVIVGGDGTINQAINSLKGCFVQFGILPAGSGNGLALGARIPRSSSKALDVIFAGKSEWTDGYLINEHFACMLSGLGFDAQVAHDFANDPKRGLTTYIKKTITHFFSAKAYPFILQAGDQQLETESMLISIANSNQFGNNFTIAPKASLTDGLLDIVVVAKQTKMSMLLQTIKQLGGFNQLHVSEIENSKASILYFQTEALQIKNPSLAPLHIDGDPAKTAKEIDVRVIKSCFRLIYP